MKQSHVYYLIFSSLLILAGCKSINKFETISFKNEYEFSSEIRERVDKDTVDWKYQIAAADYATKGDYKNALEQWDFSFPQSSKSFSEKQIDSLNLKYKVVSAVDYIVEQSKSNTVIIINEAHHNSFHRVFTKSLLQKLYDNGYKNLGLEALTNGETKDSLLDTRRYPVMESGHYTKDPQFGNLIRTALEIGYSVFPYETTSRANGNSREIEQAKNIQKVIESKPNEKFLIHCGFDHALEGEHSSWGKAMAGRLAEFTGINPLTINQVQFSERSKLEYNHPLLRALGIRQPSVLLDQENKPFRYERAKSWSDIAVFHPITNYINERPHWLFDNGNKRVSINLNNINIAFPVMVMAFKKGENIEEAVPIDVLEVSDMKTLPILALPKGLYEIVIVNEEEAARNIYLKVK